MQWGKWSKGLFSSIQHLGACSCCSAWAGPSQLKELVAKWDKSSKGQKGTSPTCPGEGSRCWARTGWKGWACSVCSSDSISRGVAAEGLEPGMHSEAAAWEAPMQQWHAAPREAGPSYCSCHWIRCHSLAAFQREQTAVPCFGVVRPDDYQRSLPTQIVLWRFCSYLHCQPPKNFGHLIIAKLKKKSLHTMV